MNFIGLNISFYFLQELLAIQQQGPRNIGFFGTRNMGFMHQELIEILSYAMVITVWCLYLNLLYIILDYVSNCLADEISAQC